MDPLGALTLILVFSIPIIAILSKTMTKVLALRAEQRSLGTSNRELEMKVERLEKAGAETAQRIENLEAIVVSQTWNVLGQADMPDPVQQHRIASASRQDLRTPAAEELNRQRAADLASRLGG
jgi:hypothetical protein